VAQELWQEILLPSAEESIWELFHENSKIGEYSQAPSNEEVCARMNDLHESLPFEGYPIVELPSVLNALPVPLDKAIAGRRSVRTFRPQRISLDHLATLLHYGYGISQNNTGTSFPRPFRVVPSGGALYPLEIFFYSASINGLDAGLYHYNSSSHHLRFLREGNAIATISAMIIQPEIAIGASLMFFITAVFERSVFKYSDRGYRFILLEAGHVAQNFNLVGQALGLASVNIGGFLDRRVDDFLGLDGLTHSTIYMLAFGGTPTS
jgi:SagB-type dehydrogenase family enzyme